MNKMGIWGITIAAAFVIGVLSANPVVEAAGGWQPVVADLQSQIDAITSTQSTEVASTIDFEIAATNTGEFRFNDKTSLVFYGDTLCSISSGTFLVILLEFTEETLVQHQEAGCDTVFGGPLISLEGAVDATFQPGERLVLERNLGGNWIEVTRVLNT